MIPSFFPLSRSAVLITVGDRIDVGLTHRIARFVELLETSAGDTLREVIPSYTTVLVEYDENVKTLESLECLAQECWRVSGLPRVDNLSEPSRVDIPVAYGGAAGPDLDRVARHASISAAEVTRRHMAAEYTVGAVGFSPGFAYLIGLPPELETPRLPRPRLAVPAGSVGIGGAQTGVYTLPTPGGWSLIGRTTMLLFDPGREDPFLFRMGDQVRFVDAGDEGVAHPAGPTRDLPVSDRGAIEVIDGGMQTTVQDLGRVGFGRFGVAINGAADRQSLVAANRRTGNPDDAAALEITLAGPHLRFHRPLAIALGGADLGARLNGKPIESDHRHLVYGGDELTFVSVPGSRGMRTYLAVAGGIDVPVVMGSRSTDLMAGFGGYQGRALRRGDRLEVGRERCTESAGYLQPTVIDPDRPIRVVRGPQADRFSKAVWRRFLQSSFAVSSESNRVGVRLQGPQLPLSLGADIISEGIVTGAIQVTGEGQPIVMLPAHATIGGYAKIATVIDEDLDRLGQLRPGDVVRFREVSPEDPTGDHGWQLPDLVRLARMAARPGVDAFTFGDRSSGTSLRIRRGTGEDR